MVINGHQTEEGAVTLSLSTHRYADVFTIAVQGEIDLSTAPELDREIAAAHHGDATAVVVDLAGVTFLDSAGINTLLKGRRLAEEHGQRFRVAGADGVVRQLLDLTGVWEHLTGQAG